MTDSRNHGMDIASSSWLNPTMRSGFLALCGLLALPGILLAQASPPIVTNHPPSVTAYLGDTVTLTATIAGSMPLTFQWQKDSVAIAGATNVSFTLTSVKISDQGNYHVVATNSHGSAQTLPALLSVTKRPQTITFNPAATTATAGSSIVLTAFSTAILPITYNLVSGAALLNGNVLTGAGGNVVVRATQAGNDTIEAAEPVERTFTFVAGSLSPFITSPPLDQTVTAGASVTFRVTAIGTPAPTYQWQKDGVALIGATNAALTFAATIEDSGRYTILATNGSGIANASAMLTVRSPPEITVAPASQAIFAGDRVSFTVSATGVPAPNFQWRKNGTTLSGATDPTLLFSSAVAGDAGSYDVVVTNALGSVTSTPATLTVTTRDFNGTYFGRFTDTAGEFALLVRVDRTAVFLAHLTGLQTGLVVLNATVDLSGDFSVNTITVASTRDVSAIGSVQNIGAAPQAVTLRGTIDDAGGAVSGTVTGLNAAFEGTRAPRTGTATALAGLYRAALIGSAADRGYIIIAADSRAFLLSASSSALDSARGNVDGTGRLMATTLSQATIDFTASNGALNGTVRTPAGGTGVIAGVIDSRGGSEHLANLSIRTVTSPGAATLITGFVVSGASPKQVLIRAAGPALAVAPFNIANAIPDPSLQLFRGNAPIAQNDDWGTPAASAAAVGAASTRAGAFPFRAGSQDAALLTTLTPGAYSVVIGGGTGTALAEIYEVLETNETAGARRLVNVSARGLVSPAAPFISGFVITGLGPQRVLIRGVGPTLGVTPFNVAGVLGNPQLTLFRGAALIKSNDDWFRDSDAALIREAAARAGAFALGASSLDAAMLLFLEPGAYTAQISPPPNSSATGLALIEIYEATP